MTVHILDVVDMQFDFMKSNGGLYVPHAEALIDRTNVFFRTLKKGTFDLALFKYDTHFHSEYPNSPEQKDFPHIHCAYGEQGWDLVVNDEILRKKMPVYYMAKNAFDMWQQNPISNRNTLKFKSVDEESAYDNLFHITTDPMVIQPGVLRDEFMRNVAGLGQRDVTVTMIGVASDFCVHDALLGYLQRGATVNVVEDLVAGIGTPVPNRAPTGHIIEVINLPVFDAYVKSGKLRLIHTQDIINPGAVQPRPTPSAGP